MIDQRRGAVVLVKEIAIVERRLKPIFNDHEHGQFESMCDTGHEAGARIVLTCAYSSFG